jgi:AAA ATPase domain
MSSSVLFQQLNSIQSNFGVQPLLESTELKAFGVEYDRDVLDDLNIILEPDRNRFNPIKKFFTGHLGCGKSTLLSECAHNQEDRYFTVFFSIADFSTYSDIDYTDILFAIGISMLVTAEQKGIEIPRSIKDSLYRWFNSIVEVQKETEGGGFNIDFVPFKFKLLRESETREEVRKKFEKKIDDLIGKLNEIAAIISDATQKPVLVIIDDLDKISQTDLQISIYSDNVSALIAPQFSIIYTLPISFYRNIVGMASLESVLSEPVLLMSVLKLVPKDRRRSIPADFSSPAIETLHQAIDRRLPDEFKQIIEPEIAREIIFMSGGVFRELIRIVDRCLGVAKKKAYQDPTLTTLTIDREIFTEAIKKIRLEFQPAIGELGYKILTATYQNLDAVDPTAPEFLKMLHRLYILEYKNDSMWYDVHPIIEDLLRRQNLI